MVTQNPSKSSPIYHLSKEVLDRVKEHYPALPVLPCKMKQLLQLVNDAKRTTSVSKRVERQGEVSAQLRGRS